MVALLTTVVPLTVNVTAGQVPLAADTIPSTSTVWTSTFTFSASTEPLVWRVPLTSTFAPTPRLPQPRPPNSVAALLTTVVPLTVNVTAGQTPASAVTLPSNSALLSDATRWIVTTTALDPLTETVSSICSVSTTAETVTRASVPDALNCNVTSPDGTPLIEKLPSLPIGAESEVPTTVTVAPEEPRTRNDEVPSPGPRPVTLPAMVAPDVAGGAGEAGGPAGDEGARGDSADPLPLHAAAPHSSTESTNTYGKRDAVELIMGLSVTTSVPVGLPEPDNSITDVWKRTSGCLAPP